MDLHVLPIKQHIQTESGANLLDVLRSNAIPISHSCQSGRCGTCKCRVVRGDVMEHVPAEGRPTAVSLPEGHVLACQATLLSDCTIEIPDIDEVVVHPARTLKGKVVALDNLTHDIKRLRVRLNKPLTFSPGQYTQVQVASGLARPYSPAGIDSDDVLEYHIRILPNGRVTQYVDKELKLGDKLRINGPLGTSYLRRVHDGPVVCIAGGTGLAPMLSIIRGALETGMTDHPIHLFFGVRGVRDVYGEETLAQLARDYPCFNYHIVLSAPAGETAYRHGLVTDAITETLPRLEGWRAYSGGPPPMVEAATRLLAQRGVKTSQIYADAFYQSTD